MFDFLDNFSFDQAIPAGYNALQFVRQWAKASADAGERTALQALPPKQKELANRIVSEIEAREGRLVVSMSTSEIDEYVKAIADKMLELSRRDLHIDPARGEAVLQEMRSMR